MSLFSRSRRESGAQAEAIAQDYLARQGLDTLQRNYRCKGGEIDLITRDAHGTIVFVEVRYRAGQSHGGALASVDRRKQQRLLRAASHYLLSHGLNQQPCRIDVVALEGDPSRQTRIEWIRNAIEMA